MNEKLMEIAELSGFYTNKGEITVVPKQYPNVSNHDITDKLTRFYRLVQVETRNQLNVAIEALEHIAIKQAKDGQAKYAIAKQALENIGES